MNISSSASLNASTAAVVCSIWRRESYSKIHQCEPLKMAIASGPLASLMPHGFAERPRMARSALCVNHGGDNRWRCLS